MTKGQMASFLVRLFDLPATTTDFFTDDDGTTHEGDVNRLAHAGITTGCSATEFCPSDPVRRDAMASFLARAIPLTDGAGNDYFRDDDGTTHEANIDRLAAAGIASGCGTWRYFPAALVSRGQMAGFLHRVEKPVPSPAYPAPGVQERHVATTGSDAGNDCLVSPQPCRSISHAVAEAFEGDVVHVGSGTFTEQLFLTIGVTIHGAGIGETILDGGRASRVVTVFNGPPPKTLDPVRLRNMTITHGRTSGDGGAILNHANLEIADTLIAENTAGRDGGAIFNSNGSNLWVLRVTLRENSAEGRGGSIFNYGYLTIGDSTLESNAAIAGGAIFHEAYPAILSNTTLTNNTASQRGGAIASAGELDLRNVTISSNGAPSGGGIWTISDVAPTIANSIVVANGGGNVFGSHRVEPRQRPRHTRRHDAG